MDKKKLAKAAARTVAGSAEGRGMKAIAKGAAALLPGGSAAKAGYRAGKAANRILTADDGGFQNDNERDLYRSHLAKEDKEMKKRAKDENRIAKMPRGEWEDLKRKAGLRGDH
jgi:hypothetical protein